MMIEEIRRKLLERHYEFSRHAVDQSILRGIRVAEVEQAMAGPCELIEDYPDDKYGPSCLLPGFMGKVSTATYLVQLSESSIGQDHYALRA